MSKNDGGAAFPTRGTLHFDSRGKPREDAQKHIIMNDGMSLRDWFAGQALIGMATWSPSGDAMDHNARAAWAYRQADAMLAEREEVA